MSELSTTDDGNETSGTDDELPTGGFPTWLEVQEAGDVGGMTTLGRSGAYANYLQAKELNRQNDLLEAFFRQYAGDRFDEELDQIRGSNE